MNASFSGFFGEVAQKNTDVAVNLYNSQVNRGNILDSVFPNDPLLSNTLLLKPIRVYYTVYIISLKSMEQKILRYVRSHTMTMLVVILGSLLFLFSGELFLYRKIMYLNRIISEGLMQIKEATKINPSPTIIMKK